MEERTEQKLEWITPEIIDLDIEKTSKDAEAPIESSTPGAGPIS